MNKPRTNISNTRTGLIRSLLTVIIGVILLSVIGFDLRGSVNDFSNDYQEELSIAEKFVTTVFKPGFDQFIDATKQAAEDNEINTKTISTFVDYIKGMYLRLTSE